MSNHNEVPLKMPLIDVFSGGGGLTLGAHMAGFRTAKAVEIDRNLSASYMRNFPSVDLITGDLNEISVDSLRLEEPFGMIGGPPCQGFSEIGRMDEADPRRTLLTVFCRRIAELRPAFFIFENVRGLLFDRNRPFLDAALEEIPALYRILEPMLLNAADYGTPTNRNRVFVVGYDPTQISSLDPNFLFSRALAQDKQSTVRDAFEGLSASIQIGTSDRFDIWKMKESPSAGSYAASLAADDLKFTGHRVTAHSQAVVDRFVKVPQGRVDPVGRHQRLCWEGKSPTLRAGTGSDKGSYQSVRPIHPSEPRVITVREAARLQGFPDSHLFHPTVWHSFRMIGNSVPPHLGAAVLSWIADGISRSETASATLAAE
ncbi:DNA cytosine methyltransferase [Pseudooceanicola sp. 502str34]